MAGRGLTSRPASVAVLTGIYVVATALGWGVVEATEGLALWQRLLAADLAATVFMWLCGVTLDNTSVYDPYWSVAPLPIAVYAGWSSGWDPRILLATACLSLWGGRLTWNFLRGWAGFAQEDWRYVNYRKLGTAPYWLLSLAGLMLMPTVLVFLGCLPVIAAVDASAPIDLLDGLGVVIAMGSLAIETLADEQLKAFRLSKPPPEAILDTGLWAWSRHPNYLGELGFWWGIACFGLAVGATWTLVGAAAITLLFWFISVPLIDARMVARRPAYTEHAKRVPRLFPFLPW